MYAKSLAIVLNTLKRARFRCSLVFAHIFSYKMFTRSVVTTLLIAAIVSLFAPAVQTASAMEINDGGGKAQSATIDKQIKTNLLRNALAICALKAPLSAGDWGDGGKRIDEGPAQQFQWFGGSGLTNVDITAGATLNKEYGISSVDESGVVACANGDFIKAALTELGYGNRLSGIDNVYGLMCEFGFRRASSPSADTSVEECKKSSGNWRRGEVNGDSGDPAAQKIHDIIKSKTASAVPNLSDAAKYVIGRNTVLNLCKADGGTVGVTSNVDQKIAGVLKEQRDGKPVDVLYSWGDGRKSFSISVGAGEGYAQTGFMDESRIHIYATGINISGGLRNNTVILSDPLFFGAWGLGNDNPCTQLANWTNQFFDAYLKYLKLNPNEQIAGADRNQKCADGSTPDASGKCADGSTVASGDNTNSCVVEGVGWMVCPIVKFFAGLTDAIYGVVETFLKVDVKTISSDPNSGGAYQAWVIMRNIANVVLVIAFLFIIFSQLTGMGVSNYGVKKALPRLIVAAILINASFFICQILVDLSNILGSSLKDLLSGLPVFKSASGNWAQKTLAEGNFFTNAATAILAGQAAIGIVAASAAAAYFVGIGIFIPIVVGCLIAIFITFFILLARQMLIVVLVVIAPLAFAAMLLPNTEQWYKRWQKIFVGMLFIYPMIAVLFGGAQLAANILVQAKPADDLGWKLAGAAVAILPLFFLPAMLKGALNAIPALSGLAQKLQARAVGAGSKWSSVGMKKLGERAAAGGGRGWGALSGAIHGNGRAGRSRQSSAQRAYEEPRMKDLMTQWRKVEKGKDSAIADDPERLAEIAMAGRPDSLETQTALSLLASRGDAKQLSAIRKAYSGDAKKTAALNAAVSPHFGALKAKNPAAVMNMDQEKWGALKQADLHTMKDDAIEEGLKSQSTEFANTLRAALQDGEQERHFSDAVYKQMGVTRPSDIRRAQQAAGQTQAATAQQNPSANPSAAAQRARDTVRQAAEGQQGNGVFVVDHTGDITQNNGDGGTPNPPAST